MDDGYYLKSLKRVYDEADKIQQRKDYQSVSGVLETYNELLPELKEKFTDHKVIQSMEKVDFRMRRGGKVPYDNIKKMQKVKMNTLRMADSLGAEVEDFERQASSEGMNIIHVNQSVQQNVDVSIEGVMQIVNNLPRDEVVKEELREIVKQYEREIQSEQPDSSTMQNLIDKARDLSQDVAVKLTMLGLKKGIDLLS